MDNKQIAKEVIEALGGRENVNSVAHCATRLRVMVKDENKINKEKAENIEKVQGAFFNSGQYQMIFGTGTVNKIYDNLHATGVINFSHASSDNDACGVQILRKSCNTVVFSFADCSELNGDSA